MIKEQEILSQAKKGQGETNERLEDIARLLKKQNDLLEQLLAARS
jgi:predicted nucleotidyltransferase